MYRSGAIYFTYVEDTTTLSGSPNSIFWDPLVGEKDGKIPFTAFQRKARWQTRKNIPTKRGRVCSWDSNWLDERYKNERPSKNTRTAN